MIRILNLKIILTEKGISMINSNEIRKKAQVYIVLIFI